MVTRGAVTAHTVKCRMFGIEDLLNVGCAVGVVAQQTGFVALKAGVRTHELSGVIVAMRSMATGTDHRFVGGVQLGRVRGFVAAKTRLRLGLRLQHQLLRSMTLMTAVAGQLSCKMRTFPPVLEFASVTVEACGSLGFDAGEMFGAKRDGRQFPSGAAGVVARIAVAADTIEIGVF